MRIEAIDTYWLRLPVPDAAGDAMGDVTAWDVIAVRARTDEGPVGWGYNCTLGEGSGALVSLLRDDLAPAFLGRDPFLVKRLWHDAYVRRHHTGIAGVAVQGAAGLEIACWDLMAQACGQPLWRLLGGFREAPIPAYSTDGGWMGFAEAELAANARRIKAAGYCGFKLKVGKPDPAEDAARMAAVRAAVGPDYPVMIDANGCWDLVAARRALARLAAHDPYWVEEPLHPFDVAAHAALAAEIRAPILAGETIYDARMFRDFIAAGALGIAQPDVLKLGGVAAWMEVAALANIHGIPVVPAGWNQMQIDPQLAAAIPNALMIEHIPWLGEIFEHPVVVEDGHAALPRAPGAGTAIRADAIERYGIG